MKSVGLDRISSVGEQGYFLPRRLAHVNLYVGNLDKTMDFYTNTLGFQEVYRTPLHGGGFVSNGNTHHDIGFIDANGPFKEKIKKEIRAGELYHLGFELESERALVDGYERATADGVKFVRTADHDIAHSVYGEDADGITYELYADVIKDWRTHRTGIVTKPKPNWAPGSTPVVEEPLYHTDVEYARIEHAIFHPLRTTHAVLAVTDLATSVSYYTDVIGLELDPLSAGKNYAILLGNLGTPALVLHQACEGLTAGYKHVCVEVASLQELGESVTKAREAGLSLVSDVFHAGRRAVIVADPDGNQVCFYADDGSDRSITEVDDDLAFRIL